MPVPVPQQYQASVAAAAQRYGVSPDLIAAVIQHESGFQNTVNPASGAFGLGQFLPSTGLTYGITPQSSADAQINATAHYLSDLTNQFNGDATKAVAAYFVGPGNVSAAVGRAGSNWISVVNAGKDATNQQVQQYVETILGTIKAGGGAVETSAQIAQQAPPNAVAGAADAVGNVINAPFKAWQSVTDFLQAVQRNIPRVLLTLLGLGLVAAGTFLYFGGETDVAAVAKKVPVPV